MFLFLLTSDSGPSRGSLDQSPASQEIKWYSARTFRVYLQVQRPSCRFTENPTRIHSSRLRVRNEEGKRAITTRFKGNYFIIGKSSLTCSSLTLLCSGKVSHKPTDTHLHTQFRRWLVDPVVLCIHSASSCRLFKISWCMWDVFVAF